jgi:hypothetical protein
VASGQGLIDLSVALGRAGGLLSAFARDGVSREPQYLADALEGFLKRPDVGISASVRSTMENLMKLARKAEGCLILSDGTRSDADMEV